MEVCLRHINKSFIVKERERENLVRGENVKMLLQAGKGRKDDFKCFKLPNQHTTREFDISTLLNKLISISSIINLAKSRIHTHAFNDILIRVFQNSSFLIFFRIIIIVVDVNVQVKIWRILILKINLRRGVTSLILTNTEFLIIFQEFILSYTSRTYICVMM